ncbi:MAG: hypothetical protein VX053_04670, partial [Pseudomonadota bacterium]|nr:hypothetical protein [Pseudomonadota bacterium]
MLAVLQSEAAGREDPAMSGNPVGPAGPDGTIPLPATAIAARFDELRRLAELEAGSTPNQAAMPHPAIGPETDMASDPLAGIDLSAGFGDAAIDMQDVAGFVVHGRHAAVSNDIITGTTGGACRIISWVIVDSVPKSC